MRPREAIPCRSADPEDVVLLRRADGPRDAPTARTVWTSLSGAAGSPLIENVHFTDAEGVDHRQNWPGSNLHRPIVVQRFELERPHVDQFTAECVTL